MENKKLNFLAKLTNILTWLSVISCISFLGFIWYSSFHEVKSNIGLFIIIVTILFSISCIIVDKVFCRMYRDQETKRIESLSSEDFVKEFGVNISIRNDEYGLDVDKLLSGKTVKIQCNNDACGINLGGYLHVKLVKDKENT